jgi:hypothetical protein
MSERRGFISDKVKSIYKKNMRHIIKDLGRRIKIFRQPIISECPNCYYDKMTQKSTGKCKWTNLQVLDLNDPSKYKYFLKGRCPICKGEGFLEQQRVVWADCLVTWDPDASGTGNEFIYTPAGSEGSTIVRLKTDPKYYDEFKNCVKIVVDGIECKLSKPPILRGLGNQTLLIITAFTTEKPSVDSNEIVKDY